MFKKIICCILFNVIFGCDSKSEQNQVEVEQAESKINIDTKANEALSFAQNRGMNTDFCILIDFSKHSGLKRFYIWDFNENKIVEEFLVSHGAGDNPWSGTSTKDNPIFSNENNSHKSSLGKYEIGERGWSQWGINIKYLLHGLESTNSNALQRVIVLHGWEAVPDTEIFPNGTPEGWGCPALSNAAMTKVDSYFKNVTKPVLLWIYNE
ncbi:murein L,D-transpeptidase catalytic domain-containing protein [Faecalibacter bovis]|uniref:Murein L,D-transpeptidase catalytic domain family protein n=1 Tax=Faecalibacter bovis TaxID=2898187 RepID=A0ABX7XAS8_9FLAO|nr:murein L,D-transpeptidase catalytic domain family protein [Faecalibacter bovis]QTV04996.1 murein L,D-transpeptidase catalytic domain family protein [Faecalibacter bovis]